MEEKKIEFKSITLEFMMDYIEKNFSGEKLQKEKEWFKEEAFKSNGGEIKDKYQHLHAKTEFCKRYEEFNHLTPKPKEPSKTQKLLNW
jgi:hypothetical protein